MYAEHFHLAAEPFGLTPDPAYLYLSPQHREALGAVQYGLLDRRGFVTLIGEVGTGKTTLLYSLFSRMGPEVAVAYVAYTTQGFEDLLTAALKDLGVELTGTTKPALLAALNTHISKLADEDRTVAIVLDEAQNLSDQAFEELRLLSNFETYTRKLLQIVLVGQPELRERLRQPQLRQLNERVSVRARIDGLSVPESHRYIEHRLQCVGGSAEALFEPRALRLIVRRAGGIPRRINILCHNALLFAYGRDLQRVTPAIAREVIAEMDEGWPRLLSASRLVTVGKWAAGILLAAVAGMAATRLEIVPRAGETAMNYLANAPSTHAAPVVDGPSLPGPQAAPAAAPVPPAVEQAAPSAPAPLDAEPAVAPVEPAPAVAPSESAAVTPAPSVVDPARASETDMQQTPTAEAVASGDDAVAITVPPGATLIGITRKVYGPHGDTKRLLPEIMRLNPHVKNANVILAGDPLRLPRPTGSSGQGEDAGR